MSAAATATPSAIASDTATAAAATTPFGARFAIHAVEPQVADALRATATEVRVAGSRPGWPCRQCLRDAEVGEELVLVSYDPFGPAATVTVAGPGPSPYRAAGPIFLHRQPCGTAAPTAEPPVQLTGRVLSVRAYDGADLMVDGRVVDGRDLATALAEVFEDPEVTVVHVHNAGPGCFAARVTRVG